jgi:hypothetical protein
MAFGGAAFAKALKLCALVVDSRCVPETEQNAGNSQENISPGSRQGFWGLAVNCGYPANLASSVTLVLFLNNFEIGHPAFAFAAAWSNFALSAPGIFAVRSR